MVIVDDFFDDPAEVVEGRGEGYPKPLFQCTTTQTNWVCKAGVSRDIIFDSVSRSSVSAGYDTIHGTQDYKTRSKEVKGPVERQQVVEKTCLYTQYVFPFAYPKTVYTLNKVTKVVEKFVSYMSAITHGLLDDDKLDRQRARKKVRYKPDNDFE